MAELLFGLEGSTAILESSGFVLITATGASLQPGLSCSDKYIKSAVQQVGATVRAVISMCSPLGLCITGCC